MNLIFICKELGEFEEELINKISKLMEEKLKKEIKIIKKTDVDNRYRADVFIIIDQENVDLKEYFKSNKKYNNLIILLNKINENTVINACKYTNNLCYIKNDIYVLCKRIYKVYLDNCEIFDDK